MLANKLRCSNRDVSPFQKTPITIDNPNPYGTSANDQFGWSVAISGNKAIIGANQEDDVNGNNAGKAYIVNSTTGALLFTLNNPNTWGSTDNNYFAGSVDISDNYAIVGSYGETDAGGSNSGRAYIYDTNTGSLLWTLNNPNAYGTSSGDYFGYRVGIKGNYAIVGAYREGDAGGTLSGKVYIYNVLTGALIWTLNNPTAYGTSTNDYFGYSVAISGNYAIIGAYGEGDAGGTSSGKAYIYNVLTGALMWTLNNPTTYGTSANDYFGNSVAISGNYAIVGAWQEDDAGGNSSGKAYIFNVLTGAFVRTLNNPNAVGGSANDYFGFRVGITTNYAIVGAYGESAGGTNTMAGEAYIFNINTGALVKSIADPNKYSSAKNDYFGFSVDISGNRAIVGAYREGDAGGTLSGKAYIFA